MDDKNIRELYEVFRVEKGIGLFLEDHIQRLFHGADKAGIKLNFNFETIKNFFKETIKREKIISGNVRLSVFFDSSDGSVISYHASGVPHSYPTSEQYQKGISCGLFFNERENTQTKIANTLLRYDANQIIKEKDYFELLLVNHQGEITEGSRSNVFFIVGHKLFTAPDQMVLPGIARKKTLEVAQALKIPVDFSPLHHQHLKDVEAAFITGTSPRILAIKSIETLNFKADHPIIHQLTDGFSKLVKSYIDKRNQSPDD
ncbi:aminotransferase class IV [Marinilabilia sp.]|uniref:aminotransferase class IV n=1 Tax=Marinilabilia sp. TaxID=2021252 RepID=UPI0025B88794|nr:aminotransferase class IV [Marinilabilia sp.]